MKRAAPQSKLPYKKVKLQRSVPLPANQIRLIKSIATKAARSVSETKSELLSNDRLTADGIVYAQNLNYQIAQGVTSQNVIGEKIFLKNINIHGYAVNLAGSTNDSPITVRLCVVRTETPLTTTTPSAINATDVFRSATGKLARQGHVDLHKVDLLYDKQMVINTDITGVNSTQPFTIRVPINKSLWFRSDNSGYLKNGDYYLIMVAEKDNAPVGNGGYVSYQWAMNFTDE